MKTVEELAKEADDGFGGVWLGNAICGIEEIRRFRDLVLEEAAKVCDPPEARPCDCEQCDCGNATDARMVAEWDEAAALARSIRAMKGQK